MAAIISVLGLIQSSFPYLRSVKAWFPQLEDDGIRGLGDLGIKGLWDP